jgi:hypothetical protein
MSKLVNNPNQSRRLYSVKTVSATYPVAGITKSSIRWRIFNKEENGFSKCIIRIERRILIDLDRLEDFMYNQAYNGGQS